MKNGYKIIWTDYALFELKETVSHLKKFWTELELSNFSSNLDHTTELISKNPELFPKSLAKKGVRKAVVDKLNTLYYKANTNDIEILSLFSVRQDPYKRNLK